jgi:hypothetical protein
MRQFLIAAAIALGAAATPAVASEAYPGAGRLDSVEVAFSRHNREHRMWEIQRTQEMMARRGGYGHRGHGYGYGRDYGGPPPHARAYGRRDRDRYYNRY